MITKNNWFNTNLGTRLLNKQADFKISVVPYSFTSLSFDDAADFTCREIYREYPSLYLALSGGLDSEFVLRCFHRNKIPITPVIVSCGNSEEIKYAFDVCKDLDVVPVVIHMSEEELVEFFRVNIVEKLNGVGYNSVQGMKVVEYVSSLNSSSMVVTGQHFIGDGDDLITDSKFAIANEWDFYANYFLDTNRNIDFFCYTQEIALALMPGEYTTWNEYKSKIYNLNYREKIRHNYTYNTQQRLLELLKHSDRIKRGEVWTKEQSFTKLKGILGENNANP